MEEDVTTYQEHRDICWKKLYTTYQKDFGSFCKFVGRCYNVSERSWKLMQVDVKTDVRNILEVTARRCYNVSGTSWKLTS